MAVPLVKAPSAHAAVAAGEVVFERHTSSGDTYTIQQRASNGDLTNLSTGSGGYNDHSPDVSADGSRIVFIGERPVPGYSGNSLVPIVMNSDGSGQTFLVTPLAAYTGSATYSSPVWSPDGTMVAVEEWVGYSRFIVVISADGSSETPILGGSGTDAVYKPSWSPSKSNDHYKIAYERANGTGGMGFSQIYIALDDGSNQLHLTGSDTGGNDGAPVWSPDGTRIYFFGDRAPNYKVYYYTTTDNWATAGNATSTMLGGESANTGVQKLKISADGSTLTYDYGPPYSEIRQVLTSSPFTASYLPTGAGSSYQNYNPTFVWADWSIKTMAVLGDSFSSGEGVEPFDSTTDTGSDTCHRSDLAYAHVLNSSPSGLSLELFTACSGATSADILDWFKTEPSQVEALDSLETTTDVVVLTIGGNDAQFGAFAEDCVASDCDGSTQYDTTMDIIENTLPDRLDSLFDDIADAVGANTRVLVLGYPYILPLSSQTGIYCSYLSSGERTAATNVQIDLNGAIQSAVTRAGEPFKFVDANPTGSPFDGHQLCASENYFNPLDLVNPEYSFHPNEEGHAAYAKVLTDYLAANP